VFSVERLENGNQGFDASQRARLGASQRGKSQSRKARLQISQVVFAESQVMEKITDAAAGLRTGFGYGPANSRSIAMQDSRSSLSSASRRPMGGAVAGGVVEGIIAGVITGKRSNRIAVPRIGPSWPHRAEIREGFHSPARVLRLNP
jgi:hypothetical protein